jgi:hypothetical protein
LQKRLLKAIAGEESKKRENKSVIKSAQKAKRPKIAKDGDGDVQMKDAKTICIKPRRDSSKMDIDEDATRTQHDASVVNSGPKKADSKETTVAKSFLKSTAELFSPNKIPSKMHSSKKEGGNSEVSSVGLKESSKKVEGAPQSGSKPIKEGLMKTACMILSSASPAQKASMLQSAKSPFRKGSTGKAKNAAKAQDVPVNKASSAEYVPSDLVCLRVRESAVVDSF